MLVYTKLVDILKGNQMLCDVRHVEQLGHYQTELTGFAMDRGKLLWALCQLVPTP